MQLQNVRTSTKLINSLQLHRSQVEGGKEKKKRGKKRKRKLRTFIKQSRAHCTLSAASTDGKFTFSSATTRKQNRSTSMNNARMTTMAIWREQAAEHLIRKLCSWSGNVRRESFFSSLSLSLFNLIAIDRSSQFVVNRWISLSLSCHENPCIQEKQLISLLSS